MAKTVWVDDIGEITLYKRKSARSVRLTITSTGGVRVSLPKWLPYNSGVFFVEKKKAWVISQKLKNQKIMLEEGDLIGRSHQLHFNSAVGGTSIVKTKIIGKKVIIATKLSTGSSLVQQKATSACERALKREAEVVFPPRLDTLAEKHNFSYKQLRICKLTSRWGSCSSNKVITLSYFMMQLPDDLIDYVILHELVHTEFLNHSANFWNKLEELVPGAKTKRKELHAHKLRLEPL